jgi:prephenate dehydrogenase
MPQVETLAVVGVGLIGGSIALAAREHGAAQRIIGIDVAEEALAEANERGMLDAAASDVAAAGEADLVVFCTPVQTIVKLARRTAGLCRPSTVLTDAGSAKAQIVRELGDLPLGGPVFVGGHPLAGAEKQGPEHAAADLFEDRIAFVTPTPSSPPEAVERIEAFWRTLGARIVRLTPEEHDRAMAYASHLPHLVAAALAGSLPAEFLKYTASGFRDTTRIAAGDAELWLGILDQNRAHVASALSELLHRLEAFRRALDAGDGPRMKELLEEGKRTRDALGN